MQDFGLDAHQLHRLSVFFLAHSMIDQLLSGTLMAAYLQSAAARRLPDKERLTRARGIPRGFFGDRLKKAKGLIKANSYAIARDINTARNDFVHRHQLPMYRGHKITESDANLNESLNDALAILLGVRDIAAQAQRAWTGAP